MWKYFRVLSIFFIFSVLFFMILNVNVILNEDRKQQVEMNLDQAISKVTDVFNVSSFSLLVEYRLNVSDYEQVADVDAFDLMGDGSEEIIVISTIWNASEDVNGLIQVFDPENISDPLDAIILANSSNDVALFEVDLHDIDEDGTTEIIITGGINSQGWAFLKVYNFTAGQLNLEWEEWWYQIYSPSLYLSGNDVLFADFDNDTTNEVCTVTTISVDFENASNIVRFWNVSGNGLVLENQFDFQTSYIELDWRFDDNLWAIDYDADNYTEILIFGPHNSGGGDDSANLYALNYTGSVLNEEAQIVWDYSDYGPGDQGLAVGDFDDDGELEILAKFQWRPNGNPICHAHYNIINYSGNQFNEEFGATYWTPGSTHQRPGHWFAKNFDADNELEFISTDYYENNTAFLRIWDYVGGILTNSEIERIETNCTYQPPSLCFLNNNSYLGVFYSKQDASGYQLYFGIYRSHKITDPTLQPLYPNPDYDGHVTLQWNGTPFATSYTVYRSNTSITEINGSLTLVGNTSATNIQDVNVLNGTHYYVVQAHYLYNSSGPSNCENVTVSILPNRRDGIKIVGDDQFTAANGVSNPAAAGNETDPFLISNWTIITGSLDAACIEIHSTRAHFVISNCTLSNAPTGIQLENVTNGVITHNQVNNTTTGIHLESSDNNTLINNTVSYNYYGIRLDYSNNNTLSHNIACQNNYGISLYQFSDWNNITNNAAVMNSDTGIWLRNYSDNNTLYNNIANKNTQGIRLLSYCRENTLTYNTANDNAPWAGIALEGYCDNNTVTGNSILNNNVGIEVIISNNNTFTRNTITGNGNDGIQLISCNNNTFIRNFIRENEGIGVNVGNNAFYNEFLYNIIVYNIWEGIYIGDVSALDTVLDHNLVFNNSDRTVIRQIGDWGTGTILIANVVENPTLSYWTGFDTDGDGFNDVHEVIIGTNPIDDDTDDDGLNDYDEVYLYFTNATNGDTDADGLGDWMEINQYGTHPNKNDTDDDGVVDSDELSYGTNPLLIDTDGDYLSDGWELNYGTNATNNDTDNDGINDYVEIYLYSTNATNSDTDGDGYSDKNEIENGTDPLDPQDYPGKPTTTPSDFIILLLLIGILVALIVITAYVVLRSRRVRQELANLKKEVSKTSLKEMVGKNEKH